MIDDFVDFVVLGVDGSDQHVVGDILQMATELEPRACGGDVVSGALSFDFDQDLIMMKMEKCDVGRPQP